MTTAGQNNFSSALDLSSEDELELVVFKLRDQEYGLWLSNVTEIVRIVAITPLPEADRLVEGIINLRGEIVPVLDLNRCLGIEPTPYTLDTHIIIVQVEEQKIGLIVDCVTKVARIPGGVIKSSQQIASNGNHLLGVAKVNDCLLIILDIFSIFRQMKGRFPQELSPRNNGDYDAEAIAELFED